MVVAAFVSFAAVAVVTVVISVALVVELLLLQRQQLLLFAQQLLLSLLLQPALLLLCLLRSQTLAEEEFVEHPSRLWQMLGHVLQHLLFVRNKRGGLGVLAQPARAPTPSAVLLDVAANASQGALARLWLAHAPFALAEHVLAAGRNHLVRLEQRHRHINALSLCVLCCCYCCWGRGSGEEERRI